MEELAVHLRDRRVGTLRSDGGALSFAYAADYLREPGAVTITYSEPVGCPVKFRWTTTIALDGSTAMTEFVAD